ncbi:MAG TPA: hypothetical protein VG734_24990 [Lacunisphaera sp.]|nr:hypothetical protein [Lacunisphaera sp.]
MIVVFTILDFTMADFTIPRLEPAPWGAGRSTFDQGAARRDAGPPAEQGILKTENREIAKLKVSGSGDRRFHDFRFHDG